MIRLEYRNVDVNLVKDPGTRTAFAALEDNVRTAVGVLRKIVSSETERGEIRVKAPIIPRQLASDPRTAATFGEVGEVALGADGSLYRKTLTTRSDTNWEAVSAALDPDSSFLAGLGDAPVNVDLLPNSPGISSRAARADHKHDLDESIAPTWTSPHIWAPSSPAYTPIRVNAASGQTADLMQLYTDTGGIAVQVDPEGRVGICDDPDAMLTVRNAGGAPLTEEHFAAYWPNDGTGRGFWKGGGYGYTDSYTFDAWIKIDSTSNTAAFQNVFVMGTNTGGAGGAVYVHGGLYIGVSAFGTQGKLVYYCFNASTGTTAQAVSTNALTDDTWHHIAVVHERTSVTGHKISIFVDGNLNAEGSGSSASQNWTSIASPSSTDISIGARVNTTLHSLQGVSLAGVKVRSGRQYATTTDGAVIGNAIFAAKLPADVLTADLVDLDFDDGGGIPADDIGSAFSRTHALSFDPTWALDTIDVGASSAAYDLTRWKGTDGTILSRIDERGYLGIGVDPTVPLDVLATAQQLRIGYDSSNAVGLTVSSSGLATFDATGAAAAFRINDYLGVGVTPTSPLHVVAAGGATVPAMHLVKPSSLYGQLRLDYDGASYTDLISDPDYLYLYGVQDYETATHITYVYGDEAGGGRLKVRGGPYSLFTGSDNANLRTSLELDAGTTQAVSVFHHTSPNSGAHTGTYFRTMDGTLNLMAPGSTYDPGGLTPRPDIHISFGAFDAGDPEDPEVYAFVAGPLCEYDQGGSGLYQVSGGVPYNVLTTQGSGANITWGGAHIFNGNVTMNAGISAGTTAIIKSDKPDGGSGSSMLTLQENNLFPYTVATDRYFFSVRNSGGQDRFQMTTSGDLWFDPGGLFTGGVNKANIDHFGNFFNKTWRQSFGGIAKRGVGLQASLDPGDAGQTGIGAEFLVGDVTPSVITTMAMMNAAQFRANAGCAGRTYTNLVGIDSGITITTGGAANSATNATGISHYFYVGDASSIGTAKGVFVESPILAATGAITTAIGVDINQQAVTGVTNAYGIRLSQSSSGYKALIFRDANAWINSDASGDLDLNVTGAIDFNVSGNEVLSVSANALNLVGGTNIVLSTTTGTKIGTGTTQLLGFWNAAPVAQSTGWSVSGEDTTTKGYTVSSVTLDQVANTLGNLIETLKTYGLLGS